MRASASRGGISIPEILVVASILTVVGYFLVPCLRAAATTERRTCLLSSLKRASGSDLLYAEANDYGLPVHSKGEYDRNGCADHVPIHDNVSAIVLNLEYGLGPGGEKLTHQRKPDDRLWQGKAIPDPKQLASRRHLGAGMYTFMDGRAALVASGHFLDTEDPDPCSWSHNLFEGAPRFALDTKAGPNYDYRKLVESATDSLEKKADQEARNRRRKAQVRLFQTQ